MSTAMLRRAIGIMVPYPPSLPFAVLLREADDVDNLQVTWGYVVCPPLVFRCLILSAISVGIRVNDTGTPTIMRLSGRLGGESTLKCLRASTSPTTKNASSKYLNQSRKRRSSEKSRSFRSSAVDQTSLLSLTSSETIRFVPFPSPRPLKTLIYLSSVLILRAKRPV